MIDLRRRRLLGATAASMLPLATAMAQDTFPARPIRVVIPYAVGGGTDTVYRLFQRSFDRIIGVTTTPDFAPGAGTLVGSLKALNAPADGYTLLLTTSALALNTIVVEDVRYKMSDFEYVGPLVQYPYMLVVNRKVPVTNLNEFIALARKEPGKLNIVSLGKGTPTSLLARRLMRSLNISVTEITYGGTAAGQTDFMADRVQCQMVAASRQYIDPTVSRPLAVAGDERIPLLPDVPTFKELGYPAMVGGTWFGVFVNKGVPAPVLKKLRDATAAAVKEAMPTFVESGHFPVPATPEEFPKYIAADSARWAADYHAEDKPR